MFFSADSLLTDELQSLTVILLRELQARAAAAWTVSLKSSKFLRISFQSSGRSSANLW